MLYKINWVFKILVLKASKTHISTRTLHVW